jgi:hypothetical protein
MLNKNVFKSCRSENKFVLIWWIDAECGTKGAVKQLRESKCTSEVSKLFDF